MINGNQVPLVAGGTGPTTIDKDGNLSTTADRVTDVTADEIGAGSGLEETVVDVTQLPDHKHDLRGTTSTGDKGNQYYALRNSADPITDIDAVPHTTNGPDSAGTGQYLTNSGGVDSAQTGQALNIMNPYLTINYIIYTGKFAA
jgi:microcystin-dependent protein